MKIVSLTLFFFYFLCAAHSQAIITPLTAKGIVVDSVSGIPLIYVTVALQDVKTKQPVKSILSQEDGTFEISAPGNKIYRMVLTFAGYVNKTFLLTDKGLAINLGKIVLSPMDKQLKEVTVAGVRPVIKREVDGISYDVSADPESVALTALDMIRKVPLLTVDASDRIKLKGSGNYKILINGKESALVARNPSDVLRAMPATNIEKIEVITTPPAKYDAEGLSGIINIITKKNIGQGYNVGINGRYNTVWGPGINVNGALKQGKFGLSAFAGHNVHSRQTTGFGNTQTFSRDNSVLSQNGTNSFSGRHNYANLELSYEIDSLNLLTGFAEMYNGSNTQASQQFSNLFDRNVILQEKYHLENSGSTSFEGFDAGLNYQLGFKRDKNRVLTISYKYNYSPNKQFTNNSFSDTAHFQQAAYRQYNKAGNKEHTVQLDFVHPFKKLTLEAGGKAIIRNNFSNFQTDNYNDTTKEYVLNLLQSNDFNYHQDIYSLYNSYQMKWDKWMAKAGLRLEYTTINADFMSVGSSINKNYRNLVPSLSIQRNFKNSTLNFGYTDRISRPGIYQLNPFVDRANPKFINTGNPDLKPELNHNLELNYSNFEKTAINIGLSYSFSKNAIQNVTSLQVDNAGDTVTLTTFQNLGSNTMLAWNFNTNITVINDLAVSINGQAGHVWLKGYYNGQQYHNDGFTGNAFLNAWYKVGKGYRVGIDAGIFSGDVNLQGKSNAYIFSSYLFSKTFLDKKATITLVSSNPYSRFFTSRSHTSAPDFYQSSFNQNPYRTFAIRFNFKFGKLNSEIKKNQRGIINDDTKPVKNANKAQ